MYDVFCDQLYDDCVGDQCDVGYVEYDLFDWYFGFVEW